MQVDKKNPGHSVTTVHSLCTVFHHLEKYEKWMMNTEGHTRAL
jgi:hypothetical protein